jgi:hypothetical protein
MQDDVVAFFAYDRWANTKVLDVQPVLAGHGPTLFAGLSKRVDLKLLSRLELASGAVALRYVPRRQPSGLRSTVSTALKFDCSYRKNCRFMSNRFSAVRQYCCYSKTPTEEEWTCASSAFAR